MADTVTDTISRRTADTSVSEIENRHRLQEIILDETEKVADSNIQDNDGWAV